MRTIEQYLEYVNRKMSECEIQIESLYDSKQDDTPEMESLVDMQTEYADMQTVLSYAIDLMRKLDEEMPAE